MEDIKNKVILVTGGTGSFGHAIANALITLKPKEVRIFSRHENLQFEMKKEYPEFNFIIGDVRDHNRVDEAMKNVDVVFHAAALKQVPECEIHPMEAVKTNIIGAYNVKQLSIKHNVSKVVFISTDKAVKPINAMGMTKALQEKIFLSDEFKHDTKFIGVRYGNIIGSRGSVVPHFVNLAKKKENLCVTHKEMTRFLLTLDDAIGLVLYALENGNGGEIFVRKSPAAYIIDLAMVIAEAYNTNVLLTKIRPGEKIHETLVHEEEMTRTQDRDDFFVIFPREKYEGKLTGEFTSNTARKLNKQEIKQLLVKTGWLN
ncbi:MAG: SDR family NAD(P)-dependent oxidoreductase [Candidatus Micrarchaeia archaeon]